MSEALERRGAGDLRLAYAELAGARSAHAAFLLERRSRESALGRKADHIDGALEAARAFLQDDPVAGGETTLPVAAPPTEALKAQVAGGRAAFDAWAREESERQAAALQAAREAVVERVEQRLQDFHPALRVEVANLAGGRAVVHLPRPRGDEAVLLCALLARHPPETYDFLADDAQDAVGETPPLASAGSGIDLQTLREGGAEAEDALSHAPTLPLLPIRYHLPLTDPVLGWPRFRLIGRGPVLELQSREEGEPYAHLVPAHHAERFTGYLVAQQSRGKLEITVDLG